MMETEILKQLIHLSGLSQKEFSEKVDIPPSRISEWLNEKRNPKMSTLNKFADELNLRIELSFSVLPLMKKSSEDIKLNDEDVFKELPNNVKKIFDRLGISSVKELKEYSYSNLSKCRNIGVRNLEEIKVFCSQNNIHLLD